MSKISKPKKTKTNPKQKKKEVANNNKLCGTVTKPSIIQATEIWHKMKAKAK